VPVDALFDAWNDTRKRNEWLTGATVKVRSATKPKYLRLDWNGNSIIAVGFLSKGSTKSSVAIQHSKLPDRATADSLRKYWSDQLENLAGVLGL
jgi:hypothetical protein